MAREVTSKHIEGITDLVVIAPIREGFINAYENVTFETRVRIVAEALHAVRVNAREFEPSMPFSDIAERILTLLNYRIGIIDQDLFRLDPDRGLTARRYVFLAVTFDGPWEPYMRLVWRPLGEFLDLIFCNCENYTPAGDSSFADYARWVRSVQVDSAIFYSTTALTVRDQIYLRELERIQRDDDPSVSDARLAQLVMADPETSAADELAAEPRRAVELGLEALTVLYRLSDYYPPDRLDPAKPGPGEALEPADRAAPPVRTRAEGRYLLRAARSLLGHIDFDKQAVAAKIDASRWAATRLAYRDQLDWYENNIPLLGSLEMKPDDPPADDSQIQAGILNPIGTDACPVRHGALLMMTVTDAIQARAFLERLPISYEGDPEPVDGFYCTIGFTVHGLRRIGLHEWKRKHFPKEFREGMERRAGLLGDYRGNHPRSWKPPARNWPEPMGESPLPPVEMAEVDFVIQLRHASESEANGDTELRQRIRQIADEAEQSGTVLAAWEPMVSYRQPASADKPAEESFGHFKLRDGLSQPRIGKSHVGTSGYEQGVSRGELLLGYRNDREDYPPPRVEGTSEGWSPKDLMFNGSFLVIRKLEQHVNCFETYLRDESIRLGITADQLKAYLVGRDTNGTPLVTPIPPDLNDFDYTSPGGDACPLGAHIRRTNPRASFGGRPAPRLMRRGMSFGPQGDSIAEARGVMFMAYCASIAEQFETIQRWINGGNSTGQSASQNDPLLGTRPARGRQVYRFVHEGQVIRTELPADPFVELHWGLYLFVPSRAALGYMCHEFTGRSLDIDEPRETRGRALIEQFDQLPPHVQIAEWRRVLEDFDSKDPAERDRSPDIWSAIRYYKNGAYRIPHAQSLAWEAVYSGDSEYGLVPPRVPADTDKDAPSVVLVGSQRLVREVLSNPHIFSVEVQGKRMGRTTGDSYVAMQPGPRYDAEATATSEIMFAQTAEWGFEAAYRIARDVLAVKTAAARAYKRSMKIELRRDFIAPTLGKLCAKWFGVPLDLPPGADVATPEDNPMVVGGWSWDPMPRPARCPGDFLAPSRNAFYPLPNGPARAYAAMHGEAIREAGHAFVARHPENTLMPGTLAQQMADAIRAANIGYGPEKREKLLGRNLIGMMIGMLPPIDGNLRGILHEWLTERTLWRHQAALLRKLGNRAMTYEIAEVLLAPVTRAMCKRPSPDLLYRRATRDFVLKAGGPHDGGDVMVSKGDLVIASLVSAAQRSLADPSPALPDGDVSFVFGGERTAVPNGSGSFHACPAQKMMMGTIIGMMAALLNTGRIKAMPSSMIVELSDFR